MSSKGYNTSYLRVGPNKPLLSPAAIVSIAEPKIPISKRLPKFQDDRRTATWRSQKQQSSSTTAVDEESGLPGLGDTEARNLMRLPKAKPLHYTKFVMFQHK